MRDSEKQITVDHEGSFHMKRKRSRISPEEKLRYAKLCCESKIGICEAGRLLSISESEVLKWVYQYQAQGELAFLDTGKNKVYSDELKLKAILSYLNGEGSLRKIAAKYEICASEQLRRWIKMYNDGKDFSHKMSGGSRMTVSRKTTKEERIQIVKDCLENSCNYGETAIKHNVSYNQVYSWVKRFRELGEEGLDDRRGKRKAAQEPRSEMEKLQIELEQLKHKLYMTEMERDLLKKVRELERKDLYRK